MYSFKAKIRCEELPTMMFQQLLFLFKKQESHAAMNNCQPQTFLLNSPFTQLDQSMHFAGQSKTTSWACCHRLPSASPHPPHQHERETTHTNQRHHDNVDDMSGETFPFVSHGSRESSFFNIVHGTRRQFHSILRRVPLFNEKSSGQSCNGRNANAPLQSPLDYSCLLLHPLNSLYFILKQSPTLFRSGLKTLSEQTNWNTNHNMSPRP